MHRVKININVYFDLILGEYSRVFEFDYKDCNAILIFIFAISNDKYFVNSTQY